jgi:putative transposase
MGKVRRYDPAGAPIFLTIVCKDHEPLLASESRKQLVLAEIRALQVASIWKVHAWVILDDHLHLLIGACADFSAAVGALKRQVLSRLRLKSIWQPRFFDHVIRDEDDLRAHLDYIHFNPRKHGHVTDPAEYAWSSFSTFARRGFYSAGWGAHDSPSTINDDTGSE